MSGRFTFACVGLLLSSACSGTKETGTTASSSAGAMEGSADCSADSRVSPYKAGIQAEGSTGKLIFTLTNASPAPPAMGLNAWTVKVNPKGGESSTSYKLSVAPYMPDHGHGPSTNPNVSAQNGAYQISDMDFFMGGVWRITATASDSNNTNIDSANFFFCVPG